MVERIAKTAVDTERSAEVPVQSSGWELAAGRVLTHFGGSIDLGPVSPSHVKAGVLAAMLGLGAAGNTEAQGNLKHLDTQKSLAPEAVELVTSHTGQSLEAVLARARVESTVLHRAIDGQIDHSAITIHFVRQTHNSPLEQNILERHNVKDVTLSQSWIYSHLSAVCSADPNVPLYKEGLIDGPLSAELAQLQNTVRVTSRFLREVSETPAPLNTWEQVYRSMQDLKHPRAVAKFMGTPELLDGVSAWEERIKSARNRLEVEKSESPYEELVRMDDLLSALGGLTGAMGSLFSGPQDLLIRGGADLKLYLEGTCRNGLPGEPSEAYAEGERIIKRIDDLRARLREDQRTGFSEAADDQYFAHAPAMRRISEIFKIPTAQRGEAIVDELEQLLKEVRPPLKEFMDNRPTARAIEQEINQAMDDIKTNAVERDRGLVAQINDDALRGAQRFSSLGHVVVVRGGNHYDSLKAAVEENNARGGNGMKFNLITYSPILLQ